MFHYLELNHFRFVMLLNLIILVNNTLKNYRFERNLSLKLELIHIYVVKLCHMVILISPHRDAFATLFSWIFSWEIARKIAGK